MGNDDPCDECIADTHDSGEHVGDDRSHISYKLSNHFPAI